MSERHRGIEIGRPDASHTILWLHGYTGSPDAFMPTAERFAQELDAYVSIPLLPGHGTQESHLLGLTFEDFLASAHHFFERAIERKKPLVLMGYSFGCFLAASFASERAPDALVLALMPYRLRFPFNISGLSSVMGVLPFWGKHLTEEDVRLREGTFYYPDLPGKSLAMMQEGTKKIAPVLAKIHCPILTLNNSDDPLVHPQSGADFIRDTGSNPKSEAHVFPRDRHTFFMAEDRTRDEDLVIEFLTNRFKKETAAEQSPAASQ